MDKKNVRKKRWISSDPLEGPAILAAIKGDQDSCAFLYHKHYAQMRSTCQRIVKDEAVARQLTQDTFACVFVKLKTFRWKAALSTWMTTIAMNICRMYLRAQKKRSVEISLERPVEKKRTTFQRTEETSTWDPSATDRNLENIDLRQAIDLALEQVSPKRRRIFLMHEVGGLQHKEIAQMLYMTEPAIKSEFLRARYVMASFLRGMGYHQKLATRKDCKKVVC